MHTWTWALILSVAAMPVFAQRATTTTGPVELRVDNLKNPLGIDDTTPNFSWQLRDAERGAKQTAYEVLVASSPELLAQGKADVWNSGRVASGQSLNVRYGGPALKPSDSLLVVREAVGRERKSRTRRARWAGGKQAW